MDVEGARVISEVLVANPNLEHVYLDENSLGNHGATLLLGSVTTAKALQYLSLDHVDANDCVAPSLLAAMQATASSPGVL